MKELKLMNCINMCGESLGFVIHIPKLNPDVFSTYWNLHRDISVSKDMIEDLKRMLNNAVKIFN